jgi:hypothetical protein
MGLTTIFGDVGSGKTLLAVILAMNDDRPIYANFKIDSPRYRPLEPEMLATLGEEPCLVIIDEAYIWLESRLSGKDINRYMSYILFQSRKRLISFILTVQLLSTIDLRFKGLTDTYVLAQRTKLGFKYTMMYPGHRKRKKFTLSYIAAQRYFPMYDTMQKIDPIDDNMIYNVTRDKASLLPKLDLIIEEMLKEAPADRWSKGMIADYCLEQGHPFLFHDMLFNRLKRRCVIEETQEGAEEAKPQADRPRDRGNRSPKGRKGTTG